MLICTIMRERTLGKQGKGRLPLGYVRHTTYPHFDIPKGTLWDLYLYRSLRMPFLVQYAR